MKSTVMGALARYRTFAIFVTVAMLCACSIFAVRAMAEGKQDFTLHNETGVDIHGMYVSPHDKDTWEENILNDDTLKAGDSVHVTFDPKEEADEWDLKVEDSAGNSLEWHDLNLTKIEEITLHWDAAKGEGTAEIKHVE